jgi:hypothetical protein
MSILIFISVARIKRYAEEFLRKLTAWLRNYMGN